MKNGILVSLLSLGLMACSAESNKNEIPELGELSSEVRGVEEQPSLTRADISEGDRLTLNTINHGNIEHYRSVLLNFTLEQDTQVALVLSSEDEDLNLTVSGYNLALDSSLDASNELVVFNALAGELYSIEVDSHSALYEQTEGSSDFQLKFVEANRASAGLMVDEYLIDIVFTGSSQCSENGEEALENSYSGTELLIINWESKYIANTDGSNRNYFDLLTNNSFTYSSSYIQADESYNDWRSTSESTATFEVDLNTGEMVVAVNGVSHSQETGFSIHCQFSNQGNARVIL